METTNKAVVCREETKAVKMEEKANKVAAEMETITVNGVTYTRVPTVAIENTETTTEQIEGGVEMEETKFIIHEHALPQLTVHVKKAVRAINANMKDTRLEKKFIDNFYDRVYKPDHRYVGLSFWMFIDRSSMKEFVTNYNNLSKDVQSWLENDAHAFVTIKRAADSMSCGTYTTWLVEFDGMTDDIINRINEYKAERGYRDICISLIRDEAPIPEPQVAETTPHHVVAGN
ncbi:MAG: hypothetical protein ACYC27_20620 [Armatimonadota bacterium]